MERTVATDAANAASPGISDLLSNIDAVLKQNDPNSLYNRPPRVAFSGVTGAIVGARNPAQVDGWIDAGALHLDEDDLQRIAEAIAGSGLGSGPLRP